MIKSICFKIYNCKTPAKLIFIQNRQVLKKNYEI